MVQYSTVAESKGLALISVEAPDGGDAVQERQRWRSSAFVVAVGEEGDFPGEVAFLAPGSPQEFWIFLEKAAAP